MNTTTTNTTHTNDTSGAHRPKNLGECVGQSRLKITLANKIAAFRSSGHCSGHVLFTGSSGTGKTTFARCFADGMGVGFHYEMATNIKNLNQFLSLLTRIQPNDIIFLDEIHALPSSVQEAMYPIIEDFHYTTYDKQGNLKTYPTPKFTLVGATTHSGDLNAAFKSRFLPPFRLLSYSESELSNMVSAASLRVHGVAMCPEKGNGDVALAISRLCRRTPRVAYNLLGDVIDTATARMKSRPRPEDVTTGLLFGETPGKEGILFLQGIDPYIGLDSPSRAYLSVLSRNAVLGERAIAAMIREEPNTMKNDIEPFLIGDVLLTEGRFSEEGPLAIITPRGRAITDLGRRYLGMCRQLQTERGWFEGEKI